MSRSVLWALLLGIGVLPAVAQAAVSDEHRGQVLFLLNNNSQRCGQVANTIEHFDPTWSCELMGMENVLRHPVGCLALLDRRCVDVGANDEDSDGWTIEAGDCDDTNAVVYPGAAEVPFDGLDNDCDPSTLDDDLDGDGFEVAVDCDDDDPLIGGTPAEDGVDNDCDGVVEEEDCDDENATVNPNAAELPFDGVDNDCNPATTDDDLDGDGYLTAEDCDDSNASRWDQVGTYEGDLDTSGLDTFCAEWCERSVSGSVDLSNASPEQVAALDCLTTIGEYFQIYNNDALLDLSGLEKLTTVGEYVQISNNDALLNLLGLENLTAIGWDLAFLDNAALTDLSGLENLTTIGEALYVQGSGALTDLSALENLTTVGDFLGFYDNDSLTDLSGLENITAIGGELYIAYNDALLDLSGLENLTTIGERLYIYDNDAMLDLSSLYNVESIGNDLIIRYNDCLETEEAEVLRDEIGEENIGGSTTIDDNGGDCPY